MSPAREREEGLACLAREVLTPEWPSASLLARYVDEPDTLEPEERRAFMAALEASPELQAQVRILQETSIAELLTRAEAEDSKPRPMLRRAAPRRRRFVPALAGALAAGAAAVFLVPTGLFEPEPTPVRSAGPEVVLPGEEVTSPPVPRTPVLPDAQVRYEVPAGASARPRRESVVHLGSGRELRGVALAPEHVGRTRQAAPTLFWHLSGFVPERGEFLLRISRREGFEPLIEVSLGELPSAGVQATSLAALDIELPLSMTYRWSVLYAASAVSAPHPVAEGWLQRYPAPSPREWESELAEVQEAAQSGFWYDALAAAHPSGGVLERARRSLLADVDLERLLAPPAAKPGPEH